MKPVVAAHIQDLGGSWRMRRSGDERWYPARVPGSFLDDLERAGVLPDPYDRDNEKTAKAECEKDCEYELHFTPDPAILSSDAVALVCEGLDTLATLELNGNLLAETDDMHRTYRIDVRNRLVAGENRLRIRFASALRYVREARKGSDITYVPTGGILGNQYLRKAHCAFGWDWGPQLPDMGIWRPIRLEAHDAARIRDLRVSQRHGDGTVDLEVELAVERFATSGRLSALVTLAEPGGRTWVSKAELSDDAASVGLTVREPLLWWPNGLGDHPLYELSAELLHEGGTIDGKALRIGLRRMEVERTDDEWGVSFAIRVNGVSFFAAGADYVPEDAILGRTDPGRTRRLVRDCARANFNCLRVWGGGLFPDDAFFDACDEQGLVVWQDLLFACNVYDLTPAFVENIRAETADNVRRIRHHASLGLWCGNNEMEWHWLEVPGISCHPDRYKRMYLEQFERILASVVAENDPGTFYWPASPSSGGGFDDPNAEGRGDMHIWDVWHGLKPFAEYRKKFPRFCSEFGFESYPDLETIRSFTSPDDRNAFSPIMEVHQKRPGGNARIAYYLADQYLQPCTFEQTVFASQLLQAEALRHGVEHWRRNRGRCMGAVYWQLNDNWPVASWSTIDSSGRWKVAHYAARRFFSPVCISAVETFGTSCDFEDTPIESLRPVEGAVIHVGNERRGPLDGIVRWALCDPDSSVLREGSVPVSLQPMEARPIADLDFSSLFCHGTERETCYLRFEVVENGLIEAEGTILFVSPRRFDFHEPKIVCEVEETDEDFRIRIRSEAYAQAVTLGTGPFVCVLSDNAFDLHGGEERTVTARKSELPDDVTAARFRECLTVLSVKDIGRISGREGIMEAKCGRERSE